MVWHKYHSHSPLSRDDCALSLIWVNVPKNAGVSTVLGETEVIFLCFHLDDNCEKILYAYLWSSWDFSSVEFYDLVPVYIIFKAVLVPSALIVLKYEKREMYKQDLCTIYVKGKWTRGKSHLNGEKGKRFESSPNTRKYRGWSGNKGIPA